MLGPLGGLGVVSVRVVVVLKDRMQVFRTRLLVTGNHHHQHIVGQIRCCEFMPLTSSSGSGNLAQRMLDTIWDRTVGAKYVFGCGQTPARRNVSESTLIASIRDHERSLCRLASLSSLLLFPR